MIDLEKELGKPRSRWTLEDLLETARRHGARLLTLLHVGGDGLLKRLDFAPRDDAHFRDILEAGERADGSSLFAAQGIPSHDSDVLLRPRLETAFLDPFSALPTLAVLSRHAGKDGTPLALSPDTILRRAHERLRAETGCELWTLGELEYFLGRRAEGTELRAGRDEGYHAAAPLVFGEGLRQRAMGVLAGIGIPVKYGHSEVGYAGPDEGLGFHWEQHEIELNLQPLPEAADAVVLTRWVLQNLAASEGFRVSLEPMLFEGHAGTGLHFHFSSLHDGAHDEVRGPGGGLTDSARWLIGGLVEAGGALMAFGNRDPGSFTRLLQGREAPRTLHWGESDRSAFVRIPVVVHTEGGRRVTPPTIEFRLPDGSALPHLLLSAAAQAMVLGRSLEGLDELLARTSAPQAGAGTGKGRRTPRSFAEIAEELSRRRAFLEAGGVFPPVLLSRLLERLRG